MDAQDIQVIAKLLDNKIDSLLKTIGKLEENQETMVEIMKMQARHDERINKNSDDIVILFKITEKQDDDCERHRAGIRDTISKKGEKLDAKEEKKRDKIRGRLWKLGEITFAAAVGAVVSIFTISHKG